MGRVSECLAQIGQAAEEKETVRGSKYKAMFRLNALHILAFFILVYVGVEVTIGGKPPSLSHFPRQHGPRYRLDCDLRHSGSPRRAIVRVYIGWIFRR